ncbi:MAG: lipid-A-disaccharide synthase [Sporocytophaga sp.]|uniref:lipid-A-disaccharide synthase n=1 Tax=Sporocytophaga sp. TaxID=2231183 RepID=UPI001AFEF194|nr:lipid-A-disaccharide synthase [Sporocytophaga sp.]MBO9702508.1 lipid-A-disaccharide synthase [Sporocytophaga sp.]
MKYYVICGERSGDLHASNLCKEIIRLDSNAQIRGIGGDYLAETGVTLYSHFKDIAFMGFWEVFKNLNTINKILEKTKVDIISYKPDVLLLVDFGGFNLKIAAFAKAQGIKVYYYISPKVWAWNQGRANKIKKVVDKMFVILPFEKDFYKKFDFNVDYVGNPVFDAVANFKSDPAFLSKHNLEGKQVIAVLPGSRKQEVEATLHYMVSVLPSFPEFTFVVAGVSNLPSDYYDNFKREGRVAVIFDETYDLLSHAKAAVVTSGTATLETALFEVPQVVVYKTSAVTYNIAKFLITVKFISLVNLIAGYEVVKELIQSDFSPSNLITELKKIIHGKERQEQLNGYQKIKEILEGPGASKRAAELMVKYLNEK